MEKYFGKYHTHCTRNRSRPGFPRLHQKRGFTKSCHELALVTTKSENGTFLRGNEICPLSETPPTLTPEMLIDLKKRYMTLKLRKLMAVEIIKNRVKSDLKQIVKQIDAQVQSDSKEFVVLGGGTKSLSYFKSPSSSSSGGGFTLEVDVRGYIPDNVSVDTDSNHMSIRATKVNGMEKALGLLAPSTAALDKVKIYPPTNGFLLIKYPNES